jgi:hypothetical protein
MAVIAIYYIQCSNLLNTYYDVSFTLFALSQQILILSLKRVVSIGSHNGTGGRAWMVLLMALVQSVIRRLPNSCPLGKNPWQDRWV